MNQSSSTSSQEIVKAPTTLDKIPEDVQLAIIKFIQSWKKPEGTEQERENGKRARDSALRSVALSCRKLLSIYQRELLFDVTLNFRSLFRFYLLLARNRDARKFVRSVTFTRREDDATQEKWDETQKDLQEHLGEIFEALRAQEIEVVEGTVEIENVVEGVYRFLSNIQRLVILQPEFIIPLHSKLSNGAPLPFLTRSLKKLFIDLWEDVEANLKARNTVWILVFCTGLRSAALGCVFDENDFKYLAEFSDTFLGLSKVEKLGLGVDFCLNNSSRRYWDRGVGKQWIGGNRKSEAIFNLLKVTKNLQCLEINQISSGEVQRVHINPSCLSALRSSYSSLESIRLFGIGVIQDDAEENNVSTNFSLFQKLRVISFDAAMVLLLSRTPGARFPSGLKILCIPYYGHSSVQEDLELVRLLKSGSLTTLEAVVVPPNPILRDAAASDSDDFKKRWLEGRRELEKAEIFQSGKVELRLLEPGQLIGEPSEIDFMSTLNWLSPA